MLERLGCPERSTQRTLNQQGQPAVSNRKSSAGSPWVVGAGRARTVALRVTVYSATLAALASSTLAERSTTLKCTEAETTFTSSWVAVTLRKLAREPLNSSTSKSLTSPLTLMFKVTKWCRASPGYRCVRGRVRGVGGSVEQAGLCVRLAASLG